jgi:tetratricopeptide (TPR) repeat protein
MSACKSPVDDMPVDKPLVRPEGPVGYQRPPVDTRFPKGKSGNPKGRPMGRPNVANLIKAIFNEPVRVREGAKTRHMPVCEAIVRSLVGKAGQGDAPALFTVMDLLEMTGRTNEISDEERAKRSVHMPGSFSREEQDLVQAPAREKDRQKYRALVESEPARYAISDDGASTVVVVPPAIKAGDELATHGKIGDALVAYRRELARCKTELTADDGDKQAQDDFRRVVARIGLLADALLLAGEFEPALKFADEAIAESATPFWIANPDPFGIGTANTVWLSALRAHARMFLGREDEARTFYLSFRSNKSHAWTSWETAILRDFARLRKAGHLHPLMDEIEKRLAEEGWTTRPGNKMIAPPVINGEDSVFIQTHPDDIKSGDLLEGYGKSDEAAAVYLRNLKKCKAKLKLRGTSTACEANLHIAVGRVERTCRELIRTGGFGRALECANEAIAAAPDKLELHAIRAHALMFLRQDNDARTLFLQHRGKKIGDSSWEVAILQDFDEQRKAGHSRPLMDEIKKQFAEGDGDSLSALTRSSDIYSGAKLEERGMFDEALAVYRRCLETCNAKIAKFAHGQFNIQAIVDRTSVLEKMGGLIVTFLSSRNFEKALEVVDCALSATPRAPLHNIYRAHALLFLDRVEEARMLYLQYRTEQVDAKRSGETAILGDFYIMRKVGLTHPLMDEIEKLFTAAT